MKKCSVFLYVTVALLAELAGGAKVDAQTMQGGLAPTLPSASAASYYYIAKPGELTIQVNIWGYVDKPGRYEIPSSTDLIQLLSFAGGPARDATLDDVRVTRFLKKDGVITKQQFTVNLEDLSRTDEASLMLRPGDTIYLDHSVWVTLRDVFGVVTTAAIVTSAVASVIIARNRL